MFHVMLTMRIYLCAGVQRDIVHSKRGRLQPEHKTAGGDNAQVGFMSNQHLHPAEMLLQEP